MPVMNREENRLEVAVEAIMHTCGLISLSQVEERTGISKSHLSKILRGKTGLTEDTLRALVTKISPVLAHQFAILSAYLLTEAQKSGFELSHLVLDFAPEKNPGVSFSQFSPDLQRQLFLIGDEITRGNSDIGSTVKWIAKLVEDHRAEYRQPAEKLLAVAESTPESSKGPFNPVGDVLAAVSKKHTEEQAAPPVGPSKPLRSHPKRRPGVKR